MSDGGTVKYSQPYRTSLPYLYLYYRRNNKNIGEGYQVLESFDASGACLDLLSGMRFGNIDGSKGFLGRCIPKQPLSAAWMSLDELHYTCAQFRHYNED